VETATPTFVDNYFGLLRNLDYRSKLELISKLSNSLLEPVTTRQEQMLGCFGSFISDQSDEEIVTTLRKSRHFRKKNIEL